MHILYKYTRMILYNNKRSKDSHEILCYRWMEMSALVSNEKDGSETGCSLMTPQTEALNWKKPESCQVCNPRQKLQHTSVSTSPILDSNTLSWLNSRWSGSSAS